MKRPDWRELLAGYIEDHSQMPFAYDQHGIDCCRFTFGAIRIQTGKDIGAPFRYQYHTRREALELMREYCGRPSLVMSITKLMNEHGFPLVSPNYAQPGDAVLAPQPNGDPFLGVVDLQGDRIASVGEHGRLLRPITIRCRAWRIE